MAELGHDVVGIDVDALKIERLQAGEVRSSNPVSPTSSGGTSTPDGCASPPTISPPPTTPRSTFSGWVPRRSRAGIAPTCRMCTPPLPTLRGKHLIIGKSTVPVGTCAELSRISVLTHSGADIELSWSPEFLREGFAVEDTLEPDRLVLGLGSLDDPSYDPAAESSAGEVIREIYREILETGVPLIETDWATAELVKVSANAFLATKISFINAIERTGRDRRRRHQHARRRHRV